MASSIDALAQLRRDGFAVLDDVFGSAEIAAARDEVAAVSAGEQHDGTAILEDGSAADGRYRPGPNQRVVSLLAKGESFRRIAMNRVVVDLARRFFAAAHGVPDDAASTSMLTEVILSSFTANIAHPAGEPMALHADQGFVPPTTPFPVLLNVVWPLVDFTADNGATRVVRGSHRTLGAAGPGDAVPVLMPSGSALLIDGRTLHGTGANRTSSERPALLANFSPPWVRPFGNHLLDLDPATLRAAPMELLDLLGCRAWFAHGHSERAFLARAAVGGATPTD